MVCLCCASFVKALCIGIPVLLWILNNFLRPFYNQMWSSKQPVAMDSEAKDALRRKLAEEDEDEELYEQNGANQERDNKTKAE